VSVAIYAIAGGACVSTAAGVYRRGICPLLMNYGFAYIAMNAMSAPAVESAGRFPNASRRSPKPSNPSLLGRRPEKAVV
jgi:hypothetical protein